MYIYSISIRLLYMSCFRDVSFRLASLHIENDFKKMASEEGVTKS